MPGSGNRPVPDKGSEDSYGGGGRGGAHSSRSQHSTKGLAGSPNLLSAFESLLLSKHAKQNGRAEREELILSFRAQPPHFSPRQIQANSSELELSLNLPQIKYKLWGGFCKWQAHGKTETSVKKIYRSRIRRRLQLPISLSCKQ